MPWNIFPKGDEFCVHKVNDVGEAVGPSLGCHPSKDEARGQMRALYANEPGAGKSVKFAEQTDDQIEGCLAPWGGIHNGRDLDGQFFSNRTNFCLDWYKGDRPLLWNHGLDSEAQTEVVGRIQSLEVKADTGLWMRAQLDRQSKFFEAIRQMVKEGKLFLSSGAMAHLVKVDAKTGELLRWPLVEGSGTPTPCNLLATVGMTEVAKHYKAAGLELPDAVKATLDAAALDKLDASDFAYIDAEGGRHLPMQDAAHARNALARFNQTTFESDAAREKARKKLVARCRELGIEVGPDMMGGKSAEIPEPEMPALKALAGSYEELLEKLSAAINPFNPFGNPGRWARIEATFPDYIIACLHDGQEEKTYRVAYSQDGGEITLGKMTEVEETYKPVAKSAALAPERIAEHTELVTSYAAALAQRTKDLSERRTKEGRVLSTATRNRLANCVQTMTSAATELQALLDSTDPARAKALEDFGRLALDIDLLDFEAALAQSA